MRGGAARRRGEIAGEKGRKRVPGPEELRRQAVAVRGDYHLGNNGCNVGLVGDFGAEIGCHRLRLAGFSMCHRGRDTPGHQADGECQRQQCADECSWREKSGTGLHLHSNLKISRIGKPVKRGGALPRLAAPPPGAYTPAVKLITTNISPDFDTVWPP